MTAEITSITSITPPQGWGVLLLARGAFELIGQGLEAIEEAVKEWPLERLVEARPLVCFALIRDEDETRVAPVMAFSDHYTERGSSPEPLVLREIDYLALVLLDGDPDVTKLVVDGIRHEIAFHLAARSDAGEEEVDRWLTNLGEHLVG